MKNPYPIRSTLYGGRCIAPYDQRSWQSTEDFIDQTSRRFSIEYALDPTIPVSKSYHEDSVYAKKWEASDADRALLEKLRRFEEYQRRMKSTSKKRRQFARLRGPNFNYEDSEQTKSKVAKITVKAELQPIVERLHVYSQAKGEQIRCEMAREADRKLARLHNAVWAEVNRKLGSQNETPTR